MEYTVLGHPVNLASRLCDRAKGGEIVIGVGTYTRLRRREARILQEVDVEPKGQVEVKGLTRAIDAFIVRSRTVRDVAS